MSAWLLDVLAAVMLAVAAGSAARLAVVPPWRRGAVAADSDAAHLLMAVAMAGMLTARLTTLPGAAWEVVFGLLTAWFTARAAFGVRAGGLRVLAGGNCAPHLVHSAAMLYMLLATAVTAGAGRMAGMAGGSAAATTLRLPAVAFVFALVLLSYSVWDVDRLAGLVTVSGRPGQLLLSPAVTVGSRVTMGVVMVFLLIDAI